MSDLTEDEINSLIGDDDLSSLGDSSDTEESADVGKSGDGLGSLDAFITEDSAGGAGKTKVRPASFAPLKATNDNLQNSSNMRLLMDVPMQVSVELGRATRSVKEILGLNIGSVVELDKLSGEPVDLLVNGRIIAKAEVVIIDENFGIRITEILGVQDRLILE